MRLHFLAITAIGPFAGTQHVDFDVLGQSGLFLLHGATGAGKTTVLDAVCFALYGQVPGARQSGGRLRSDHAADSAAPRVVLEVTLRGRRLRIDRTAAWDRPKRRGTGTTREQARVSVCEIEPDGTETVRCSRLDEAGHFIGGLLGLSCEQFCQVVLLPQGAFATFLRAGADERRALLEKLFGTERFSRVEQLLAWQRRSTQNELAVASLEVDRLVDRIAQEAGLAQVPAEARAGGAAEWAGVVTGGALSAADEAAARAGLARRALDEARAAEALDRQLDDRHRRAAALRARHDTLAARAAERTTLRARVDAARRAAPVGSLLDLLSDESATTTSAERAAATARSRPALAGAGLESSTADVLLQAAERAAAEVLRLGELSAAADELAGLEQRLRGLDDSMDEQQAAQTAHVRWSEGATQLRAALAERCAGAEQAEALLQPLGDACARAESRARAAVERDRLSLSVRAHQAEADVLRAAALDARTEWLDIRQKRLDGMAAELAAGLRDGDPCKVCGSPSHPSAAPAAPAGASAADDQAAQRRAEAAQDRHGVAVTQLGQLQLDLAAARTRAEGDLSSEEVAALAAATQAALRSAQRRAADAAPARTALSAHDADVLRRQTAAGERERSVARLQQERVEVSSRRDDLVGRLQAACGDDATLGARVERLSRLDAAARAAADALRTAELAALRRDEVARRADVAAAAAGFATAAEAADGRLATVEADRLEQALIDDEQDLAAVRQALGDPELAQLTGAGPDLTASSERSAAAEVRCSEAHAAAARAQERVDQLEHLTVVLAGRVAALDPIRDVAERVKALSELLEGSGADNMLRMRLSSYVLAARLEQVAAAASERLVRMSAGRYTLVHSDAVAGGRSRSGLALQVCDGWTGLKRETASLSGGETFMAALSLALGLADVVTAEAGGAALDTLFIDEGFGSLDEASLEEVMDGLDGLRAGGRIVGIVSHVGELRSRIPTRLHVRMGPSGSSATLEDGEGASVALRLEGAA